VGLFYVVSCLRYMCWSHSTGERLLPISNVPLTDASTNEIHLVKTSFQGQNGWLSTFHKTIVCVYCEYCTLAIPAPRVQSGPEKTYSLRWLKTPRNPVTSRIRNFTLVNWWKSDNCASNQPRNFKHSKFLRQGRRGVQNRIVGKGLLQQGQAAMIFKISA